MLATGHKFIRFSNGKNKMAAKTRWPTIQKILVSLDRFVTSKIFFMTLIYKTV